jgi:hypothetical protein
VENTLSKRLIYLSEERPLRLDYILSRAHSGGVPGSSVLTWFSRQFFFFHIDIKFQKNKISFKWNYRVRTMYLAWDIVQWLTQVHTIKKFWALQQLGISWRNNGLVAPRERRCSMGTNTKVNMFTAMTVTVYIILANKHYIHKRINHHETNVCLAALVVLYP